MTIFWYSYIAIGALLGLAALLLTQRKGMPAPTFIIAMTLFILVWPLVIAATMVAAHRRRNNAGP